MAMTDKTIAQLTLQLLHQRAADASICPSEVARTLSNDAATWRAAMPQVRAVAADLQDAGTIRITRGGAAVTRENLTDGPVRLRRGAGFPSTAPSVAPREKAD